MQGNKYPTIDSLNLIKVIAASIIVFHHYQQVFECSFGGVNFFGGKIYYGYMVELFFMISGFLTVYTLSDRGIGKDLLHKLGKLYPMTFIACLFCLFIKTIKMVELGQVADLSTIWNGKVLIANIFLLFSGYPFFDMIGLNNPTWYICILIQCYIVFCVVKKLIKPLKRFQMESFLFLGIVVVAVILFRKDMIYDASYRGLTCFFVGAILEDVLCSFQTIQTKITWGMKKVVPLICAILSVLLISYGGTQRMLLVSVVFPILLIVAFLKKEIRIPWVNIGGVISFDVYIWHYPIMALFILIGTITGIQVNHSYMTMILFLILVWAVASILYRFVDKPIQTIVKRVEKRLGI